MFLHRQRLISLPQKLLGGSQEFQIGTKPPKLVVDRLGLYIVVFLQVRAKTKASLALFIVLQSPKQYNLHRIVKDGNNEPLNQRSSV